MNANTNVNNFLTCSNDVKNAGQLLFPNAVCGPAHQSSIFQSSSRSKSQNAPSSIRSNVSVAHCFCFCGVVKRPSVVKFNKYYSRNETQIKLKRTFIYCYICLAQIWFEINVLKQVMKLKGYIATLIMLILIIRSWTERDLFKECAQHSIVSHSFHWISKLRKRCASILLA